MQNVKTCGESSLRLCRPVVLGLGLNSSKQLVK